MDTRIEKAHETKQEPWFRSRSNWVWLGFAVVAGFFLVTEHRAHTLGALPLLLVLACPLMHLLHHGGHGSHRGHSQDSGRQASSGKERPE